MLSSLLLTSLLTFGASIEAQPINNTSYDESIVQVEEENSSSTKLILKRNQRISSDIFELEYEFDTNISNANIISDSVILKDLEINNKLLTLQLQTNFECSKFDLNVNLNDGTNILQPVYAYKDTILNSTFVSNDSIDSAWYLAKKYGYEQEGIYDSNDIIEQYDQFASRDVEQEIEVLSNPSISPASISSFSSDGVDTKVEGYLYWKDKNNIKHPLKYSRVDLYDTEFGANFLLQPMGTTYTDENGYYSFEFDNADGFWDFEWGGYDPMIRIYPIGKTFEVAREWIFNDWIFSFYYKTSRIASNIPTGSTTQLNITIPYSTDDNTNKAFSISQAMSEAQEFANKFANMPLNKLHLNVAFPGTLTSFSWNGFSAINQNDWNNWRTIIHEYGHYVENVMGTYGASLWEIIINNPSHYINTDHLNDKNEKEYAMELTWSEAWATVFAMIVYDNVDYLSNIPYADGIQDYISSYNNFTPSVTNSGEGQEEAIISYLWDIYDKDNESGDDIGLGTNSFFSATLRYGMYTLTDFIDYFEENYSEIISQNGQLLENNQIAPNLLPFYEKAELTRPLTIEFYPNGSSYNPNDEFDLEFLSPNGERLATSYDLNVNVTSNKTKVSYTIPYSIWELIYEKINPYPFVYVTLAGYHSKSPKSGPYHSAYETLVVHDYAYITPEMYGFPEGYCSTAETKLVEADGADFYTTRLRTGFIEDEYINLCPRKEGYGTAYLEYDFFEPISKIDINLSFWSDDERYYVADDPEARIEYWDEDSNSWVECLDLLEANLPTDRNNQKTYTIEFEEPVLSFRIYTHFNNMTGYTDRNKGRISIGDMIVYFD